MEVIGSIFGEDAIVHRAPMLNIPALTYYLLQRLSTELQIDTCSRSCSS